MVKLSHQLPNTPFLMFTDRDIGGFKNYLTLTCGAQKKGNNENLTLPAVNYVNFISTKKQRITLTDESSLETKLKNYSTSTHPRMRFFRNFFAQMRSSGGKTSLVTAKQGELYQQIDEVLKHHEGKKVNLNATLSQRKEFIEKTCVLDAFEAYWFIKNKNKIEDYWVDNEMPHQVLNWICSMASEEFGVKMLPIQVVSWQLIPEYIPSSDESDDIQFYQTISGTYHIFKFDPMKKSVSIFMPNVNQLIRIESLKFEGIKPKYNNEKKEFNKMYREKLNTHVDGCNADADIADEDQDHDQDEDGDYADDEDSVIVNMDAVNFHTQFNSGTITIEDLVRKTKVEKEKTLDKQMKMFQNRVNKYHNDNDNNLFLYFRFKNYNKINISASKGTQQKLCTKKYRKNR